MRKPPPKRKLRIDSPTTCSCSARYQKIIAGLTQKLEAANDKIAVLSLQLENRDLLRSNGNVTAQAVGTLKMALASLTKREHEVARLFMQCASDKLVASQLGIAVQTVRNQIAAIQNKLQVNSREELVLLLASSKRIQAAAIA